MSNIFFKEGRKIFKGVSPLFAPLVTGLSSVYQNVQTCILEVNSTRIDTRPTTWHCVLCKVLYSHTQRARHQTCFTVTKNTQMY